MNKIKIAALVFAVSLGISVNAQDTELTTEQPFTTEELLDLPPESEEFAVDEADPRHRTIQIRVRCVSLGRGTVGYCASPGPIVSVRLARRLSRVRCVPGRNYGFTRRYMWVSRGCQGDFWIRYRDLHGRR